jgi:hypothetical protein
MKKNLFLIFMLLNSTFALGQSEWRLKGLFGFSKAALLDRPGYVGGGSSEIKDFFELGIRIEYKWDSKWGLETGATYSFGQIFAFMGVPGTNPFPGSRGDFGEEKTDLRLVSMPVLASYHLFDFLAIQGGPMMSFQLSDFPTTRQSGLGYMVGLSLDYDWKKVGLFLQPNFKRHATVSFVQSGRRLTELGIQAGVSIPVFSGK